MVGRGDYSLASLNSPSSMPSPTNQWTNARLLYIMSNLPSSLFQASAMAVVLELSLALPRQENYSIVIDRSVLA